jgi:hypothetical protein
MEFSPLWFPSGGIVTLILGERKENAECGNGGSRVREGGVFCAAERGTRGRSVKCEGWVFC